MTIFKILYFHRNMKLYYTCVVLLIFIKKVILWSSIRIYIRPSIYIQYFPLLYVLTSFISLVVIYLKLSPYMSFLFMHNTNYTVSFIMRNLYGYILHIVKCLRSIRPFSVCCIGFNHVMTIQKDSYSPISLLK